MIRQRKGCCRRLNLDDFTRPSSKPPLIYAKNRIRPFTPGQPKETYTSEQDFIQKRTKLIRQSHRPIFVTRLDGRRRTRLHMPIRNVTSDSWRIYQQKQKQREEFRRLFEESSIGTSDSESFPFDFVDASAAGLNHPLLEEKPDLEVLSSAPLDALDATEKAATVTEPMVEGLPCDPDLDIPAAGFSNSLLDAQAPEITAAPVGDLVAESLLGDKHDGGPKGKHVLEGSSSEPHGEDESLGTTAKKKAHQKMHDKKKCKSIVLSPGRLSMKKMKMGRNLDGFSQDNKLVALVKRVVKEEMKKEVKTLKRKFKSYINE